MITPSQRSPPNKFIIQNSLLSLSNKRIAFTTPQNYAFRLSHLLQLRGLTNPLWCPTVVVEQTPHTKSLVKPYLIPQPHNPNPLSDFSAIAFTSRTGILAFSEILTTETDSPPLDGDDIFTIAALGRDALLLDKEFLYNLCKIPRQIRVLIPAVASPSSLVESLGFGDGRKVLCPVPLVIGLTEPPVVPDFLRHLSASGWVPVRVSAYETRWAGRNCAEALVWSEEVVDAIVVTSTAEVEGMLKSLKELGFDWEMVKKKWPQLVVAAHGPVTAAGAERLGVGVDVVSSSFGSFEGVVDALIQKLREKLSHLWQLEGAKERLELVKADLMEDGSFDDAIIGCSGVFHTASPVLGPKCDPKAEILDPAIKGTLNVLRSCKKNPHLKRVVLTSSSAAVRVREDFDPNVPLDETTWSSVELCERLQIWYPLSKILAEKAAWEFATENGLDLVTVLPSFLIGPSLPHHLCATASDVLGLLNGDTGKFSWHGRMGYVHIDDVALCHILVYEEASAEGRYICSSAVLDNNELASFLAMRYPNLPIPKRFERLDRPCYELSTLKLKNLGFSFKGLEEMFDDCVASLKAQGHLIEK